MHLSPIPQGVALGYRLVPPWGEACKVYDLPICREGSPDPAWRLVV